jgi:hypothetical protein
MTTAVAMNSRYRDIFLLARIIEDFEELAPVTPAMIEELFEADFLYLQLLYKEMDSGGGGGARRGLRASVPRVTRVSRLTCPTCIAI